MCATLQVLTSSVCLCVCVFFCSCLNILDVVLGDKLREAEAAVASGLVVVVNTVLPVLPTPEQILGALQTVEGWVGGIQDFAINTVTKLRGLTAKLREHLEKVIDFGNEKVDQLEEPLAIANKWVGIILEKVRSWPV